MLGNTVDSPSFAMATFVGHSFLNSTHSLDIYNITLPVDSHVCGQRNNSIFSERPGEHVAGALPLPLCVGHLGESLEDGGSVKLLLIRVKEESEKAGLKLNVQKTKIMASGPITSWEIDGETVETVPDFIFLGSKITADGDCNHEIKRHLLLFGRNRHLPVIRQDDQHKGKEAGHLLHVLQAFQKTWSCSFGDIHENLQEG